MFKLSSLKKLPHRSSKLRGSSSQLDVGSELQNGPFNPPSKLSKAGPALNGDIMYLILEHAYFNDSMRPNFAQFTRFARVNRAWQRPAQALLFHEITIRDDAAYRSLEHIFEDSGEHAKWLRGCIRVLNYWIFSGGKHNAGTWESRLPITMKACPQLYELRLGVDAVGTLSAKTIRELNETSPPIRALQIAMRSDEAGRTAIASTLPIQVLTAITSWKLEFLVMRGDTFAMQNCTTSQQVSHQLTEFRWTVTGGDTNPAWEAFITWVTSNSIKSLEILHLPKNHDIIAQIGTGLRSLRVPDIAAVPDNLKGLRELILTTPTALTTEVAYYSKLPPNLVHFGTAINAVNIDGRNTASSLRHKLPQKLKTLSVYAQSHNKPRYPPVKTRSYYPIPGEDVVLRLFSGFDACQVGMRSDLVRSKDYPRDVTLDNMRYMSRIVANNAEVVNAPSKKGLTAALIQKIGDVTSQTITIPKPVALLGKEPIH